MSGNMSPASGFKLGSGLVTTGFSLFGNNDYGSSFAQSPNPYSFDPYQFVFNPYEIAYNPYKAGNPAEGLLKQQFLSSGEEALLIERQGQIAMEEATRAAFNLARDAKSFREEQANAYNASGVLLEGSPMMVLEETRNRAKEEVDALIKHGAAVQELENKKAFILRNNARSELLGAQTLFGAEKTKYEAGMALANSQFQSQLLGQRAAYRSQGMTFQAQQAQQRLLAPRIGGGNNLGDALYSLGGLFGNRGGSSGGTVSSPLSDPYGHLGGPVWGVP